MSDIINLDIQNGKIYYTLSSGEIFCTPFVEYDYEVILQIIINNYIRKFSGSCSDEELSAAIKIIIDNANKKLNDYFNKYIFFPEEDYVDFLIKQHRERIKEKYKDIEPDDYINLSEEEYQKIVKSKTR